MRPPTGGYCIAFWYQRMFAACSRLAVQVLNAEKINGGYRLFALVLKTGYTEARVVGVELSNEAVRARRRPSPENTYIKASLE